jgi:phenylalanyl-tRNA synthetase beta chain
VDLPTGAEPVWFVEVALPTETAAEVRPFRLLPSHPASERDLALQVPEEVAAGTVRRTIAATAGELLESVDVFDVYAGPGMPPGVRSIGWRLRFRAGGRTLTDAEVDGAVARVLAALEEEHGVRLR